MKWISFINENAYKILYPWHKDDETGTHTHSAKTKVNRYIALASSCFSSYRSSGVVWWSDGATDRLLLILRLFPFLSCSIVSR